MPFVKGQSGTPGGRPKRVLELIESARKHVPKAIKRAKELLRDPDGKVAMTAATFLRDTGMGKPAALVSAAQLTDEELVAELKLRRQAREDAEHQRNRPSPSNLDA